MTDTTGPKPHANKSIFLVLMAATGLLVAGGLVLLWWLQGAGLAAIHPNLPRLVGGLLIAIAAGATIGTLLLVVTTALGRDLPGTLLLRAVAIRLLLPIIEFLGRIAAIPRDTIRQSFIAMNNSLVLARKPAIKPDRILILLPHCLQLMDCDIKVTGEVGKCVRCGRCDIAGLAALAEKYQIDISVVTGGTLARKIIMEKRPKLVLAVACEGDLTTGIRDCYPLPVLGILNERPCGPCINTTVDTGKIDEALRLVMG
jgi:uncharacterized protein